MHARLVVVSVVLIAGLVECMPQIPLQAEVQLDALVGTPAAGATPATPAAAAAAPTAPTLGEDEYFVGTSKRDITGPIGSKFSGFDFPQIAKGLHMRLFARAFVFGKGGSAQPLVHVVVDRWIVSNFIRVQVLHRLQELYGDLYTQHNLAISATHTHSGTSVWSQYGVLQFSTGDTPYTPSDSIMVDGIVEAISDAHRQAFTEFQVGYLVYRVIDDANPTTERIARNRAPRAFAANKDDPQFATYRGALSGANVDPRMTILKVMKKTGSGQGTPIGALSWFGVQGTSLDVRQEFISGDNKGVAAFQFERAMRANNPNFVGAFPNAAFGDSSPNVQGPTCMPGSPPAEVGKPCDFNVDISLDSTGSTLSFNLKESTLATCGDDYGLCAARGPLYDTGVSFASSDYWNARENGHRQFRQVLDHFDAAKTELSGHTGWHKIEGALMARTKFWNVAERAGFQSCNPAVGWAYLAGSIDGTPIDGKNLHMSAEAPKGTGAGSFEGTLQQGAVNSIATMITSTPNAKTVACQGAKRILGAEESVGNQPSTFFGRTSLIQIFTYGTDSDQLATVQIPLAPTGFAGYKISQAVKAELGGGDRVVQITGVANAYHGYLTTANEYATQRFEGSATLFGPDSNAKLVSVATELAKCLKADNCPSFKSMSDPSCPNGDDCELPTPANATSVLNGAATFALTLMGKGGYQNSNYSNPANVEKWGQYLDSSLVEEPSHHFTATFGTTGSFNAHITKQKSMEVQCRDKAATEETWVPLYSERDPETIISYALGSSIVQAKVQFFVPDDFAFDTYDSCRFAHFCYNSLDPSDGIADVDALGSPLVEGTVYSGHSVPFTVRRATLS